MPSDTSGHGIRALGALLIFAAYALLGVAAFGVVVSLFKGVRPKDVIALPASIGAIVLLVGLAGVVLCKFGNSLVKRG